MKRAMRLVATVGTAFTLSVVSVTTLALAEDAKDAKVPVDKSLSEQSPQFVPSVADVDRRQRRLEARVKLAHRTGRLNTAQTREFDSLLDQIAEEEAKFRVTDGILTPLEALKITLDLDEVSKLLDAQMMDRKVATLNVDTRISELTTRIQDNVHSGRLTLKEGEDLKARLLKLIALTNRLRSERGLSYGDLLTLSLDLDQLNQRLGHYLERRLVVVPSTEKMHEELEKKIAQGVTDGKISQETATQLRKDIQRVLDLPEINQQDTVLVAMELERLGNRIDEQLGVRKPFVYDFNTRKEEFSAALGHALDLGRVGPAEAFELKADLDKLAAKQSTMLGGDGKLTDEEIATLAFELERLYGRFNVIQHEPTTYWPGVDAAQAFIDHRIGQALKAKRISDADAAALRAQADKLAALEETHRKSGDKMDAAESIHIAREIHKLAIDVQRKIKDRPVTLPDVGKIENELYHRVADGIDRGTFDPDQGIKDALNRISVLKSHQKPDGEMDEDTKLIVATELERLSALVEMHTKGEDDAPVPLLGRAKKLSHRIDEGLVTGRLTDEQVLSLKNELQKISDSEDAYRMSKPGLTADESLELMTNYAQVSGKIEDAIARGGVAISEVVDRLTNLKYRIGIAVYEGRITLAEADALSADVDKLSNNIARARATDGGVSYTEGLVFAFDAENVGAKVERQIKENPRPIADVEAKEMALDLQLANALASGQIEPKQAQLLRSQLQEIQQQELAYRASGGGFSPAEKLAIALNLNRAAAAIGSALKTAKTFPDLNSRQSILARRVKELSGSGKIPAQSVALLNDDLDRIAQSEAAFRVSEEGLSFMEALTLSLDLDRVASRIDSLSKPKLSVAQINSRLMQLQNRLKQEIASGKISGPDANRLKKELELFERMKVQAIKGPSRTLSTEAAVRLSTELDRLSASIEQ